MQARQTYSKNMNTTAMKILLDINDTCQSVSLSESTIRRLMREGRFPQSVTVGSRVLWREADLQQWASQLAAGDVSEPGKKRGRPRLAV